MATNDRALTSLMKAVDSGAAQLPDFQRGWVYSNDSLKYKLETDVMIC